MYSYTAANLAEQTHSIVVVPTITDFYKSTATGWAEEPCNKPLPTYSAATATR